MVEFRVRGVKADLSKLTVKQHAAYIVLRAIEPTYVKLRNFLQRELNRIANLEAIARGQELWEKFQVKKKEWQLEDLKIEKAQSELLKVCRHLKGGRRTSTIKDYAVSFHTFPDGSVRIKCLLCPKAWYPTDADWKDAMKMVESSTNTPSSSEVSFGKGMLNLDGRFIYNADTVVYFEKKEE